MNKLVILYSIIILYLISISWVFAAGTLTYTPLIINQDLNGSHDVAIASLIIFVSVPLIQSIANSIAGTCVV